MAAFKNTYYLMRHGQSEANVAGKIVSDPAVGCVEYGLTEVGEGQARASAERHKGDAGVPRITVVVASDFTRARETAAIAAGVLGVEKVTLSESLRERFFGELEGQSSDLYPKVWAHDANSCTHTEFNVESVTSVRRRALSVIAHAEASHSGRGIVLVAHGDTLQILSTAFHGMIPGRHRELPHHETGDIKLLVREGAAVPAEAREVLAA